LTSPGGAAILLIMKSPARRVKIEVNDGARGFTAQRGQPLLFALMAERIFVPSACGGKASCGQCRVRVLVGAEAYGEKELPLLSAEERQRGVHLSCQLLIRHDLRIAVPESHLHARQYQARVASMRDLAQDMREVVLELREPREMPFTAGQYVQFLLPSTEGAARSADSGAARSADSGAARSADSGAAQPVYRAYSIASPPSSPGRLTLVFGKVPDGAVSGYVFEHLKPGDNVTINGPFGDFSLREGERELIFVAGGSGMAPIRAILLDMAEKGVARPATFFFAARTTGDLFYLDDMQHLQERLPRFRFVPILSHAHPDDGWQGERGGIAPALSRLLPDLGGHEAYLCGSPGMIDASIAALRARGLADDMVFFDKFS
jgi:Na+-transporting NADH:ubiquinone oxidoreductase subunit F